MAIVIDVPAAVALLPLADLPMASSGSRSQSE
jgi:hypothetical protein